MMDAQRYFMRLAYQGDNYCGWQWQRNADNSIQGTLQTALTNVLRQPLTVIGCGRTDAGVHAEAYYAHFDYADALPPHFMAILNRALPSDIAVQRIWPVASDVHARFSATQRTYRYFFHTHKQPHWRHCSTYLPGLEDPLDFAAMQAAAQLLLQYEDYRAFCKVPDRHAHTRCQVSAARFQFEQEPFSFQITANRFVRGMVRLLVAQLLEVGKRRTQLTDFEHMLKTGERPKHLVFAPPQGLYLTHVNYPSLTEAHGNSDHHPGASLLR
jgi:tRNA pseudouridine38-40 synthase